VNSIEAYGIVKTFNGFTAVDNLSFSVEEGEIFGLLGPNGAGKTTTIRMLAALISPSAGSATIGGHDVQSEALRVREIIGILTESPSLYDRLTAMENMEFFAKAYGVTDNATREAKIHDLLEFFQLWDRRDDSVGKYSKGMKQKLAIARALVHSPAIIYLDEPTSGLDPKSSKDIRDLMEDAEKLCDRVMIINHGKPLAISSPHDLRRRFTSKQEIQIGLTTVDDSILDALHGVDYILSAQSNDNTLSVSLRNESDTPDLVKLLVDHGARIQSVSPVETSLEDAYLELVEGDHS
jgi:ABC-2 type transport system ATP-binding protein